PVQARFHRLPTLYLPEALPVWALAWARSHFHEVEDVSIDSIDVPTRGAQRLQMRTSSDDGVSQRFDLRLFNRGTASYLLETWGEPEVMADQGEALVTELIRGLRVPEDSSEEDTGGSTLAELDGLRLTLPDGHWRSTRDGSMISFALDGRLIEGVVLAEILPYPLSPVDYGAVALGNERNQDMITSVAGGSLGTEGAFHDIRMEIEGPTIEYTRHHRFVTSGVRAYQIVLWTPSALYEQNRLIMERVLATTELD
ncbi:MAG: hypothetical protein ACNA8W_24005, partial [Bradymonadaceae bacterium]